MSSTSSVDGFCDIVTPDDMGENTTGELPTLAMAHPPASRITTIDKTAILVGQGTKTRLNRSTFELTMEKNLPSRILDSDNTISGLRRSERWAGTYLLHIRLTCQANVCVGQLNRGAPISFVYGEYVYVGSAMGKGDGLYLPKRLVRHATRSGAQPVHAFRTLLLDHFAHAGLSPQRVLPTGPKRLFWNIDYLLDRADVELQGVFYVRSDVRYEESIASWLAARPDAEVPAPGFGAHDHPGHTHLFRLTGEDDAWNSLHRDLAHRISTEGAEA